MEDKKMKPVRVSEKKRNDNQIHLRERDKGKWVARSMNGFGKPKYSLSNMIRYAVNHMDDGVGVSLKDADSLIKCIAGNRMVLATFEADFRRIIEEINRLGNNVNQIAKKINLLMLKAEENGTEVSEQCRELLQLPPRMPRVPPCPMNSFSWACQGSRVPQRTQRCLRSARR